MKKIKKTKGKQKTVGSMTRKEVEFLASRLVNSSQNVYQLCRTMFTIPEPGEEVFDRLEKETGIFRCEICSIWKYSDQKADLTGYDPDFRKCQSCEE